MLDQCLCNNNNNNNNNLYLSVKAKIAVTEPLNGDTISVWACAMLARLVRFLTANQPVQGSIPNQVES